MSNDETVPRYYNRRIDQSDLESGIIQFAILPRTRENSVVNANAINDKSKLPPVFVPALRNRNYSHEKSKNLDNESSSDNSPAIQPLRGVVVQSTSALPVPQVHRLTFTESPVKTKPSLRELWFEYSTALTSPSDNNTSIRIPLFKNNDFSIKSSIPRPHMISDVSISSTQAAIQSKRRKMRRESDFATRLTKRLHKQQKRRDNARQFLTRENPSVNKSDQENKELSKFLEGEIAAIFNQAESENSDDEGPIQIKVNDGRIPKSHESKDEAQGDKISAQIINPQHSATVESSSSLGVNLAPPKLDACTICGNSVSAPASASANESIEKRRGSQPNRLAHRNVSIGNLNGNGSGLSSKSALVKWFTSRMTCDQLLMVASFEDESVNFMFANQPKSVLSTAAINAVPAGWIPNAKLSGFNSTTKRRQGPSHQNSPPNHLNFTRSNYFGYHDSRRKLPVSGVFKHYQSPEDHTRFYRLHFTLGETGRYGEMWRHSVESGRLNREIDEMLLMGPLTQNKSFVFQQQSTEIQEVASNSETSRKISSQPEMPRTEDINLAINSENRLPRPASDAVSTGLALTLPAAPAVATTNNAHSSQPYAGPWPIRPWTLAQLEGKKLPSTSSKAFVMAGGPGQEASEPSAISASLLLQPVLPAISDDQPEYKEKRDGNGQKGADSSHSSANSESSIAQPLFARGLKGIRREWKPAEVNARDDILANGIGRLLKDKSRMEKMKTQFPPPIISHLNHSSPVSEVKSLLNLKHRHHHQRHGDEKLHVLAGIHRHHHRRRNSLVRLKPIDQSEQPNSEYENDSDRANFLSLSIRPRSSSLVKPNKPNLASASRNIVSLPLTALIPFPHNNSTASLSKLSLTESPQNSSGNGVMPSDENNKTLASKLLPLQLVQDSSVKYDILQLTPKPKLLVSKNGVGTDP